MAISLFERQTNRNPIARPHHLITKSAVGQDPRTKCRVQNGSAFRCNQSQSVIRIIHSRWFVVEASSKFKPA